MGHHNQLTAMIIDQAHDNVIKWKHFPFLCPFVRRIHRSPVDSHNKGQWCGALMFSLICAWTSRWAYNGDAGDLSRHYAHHDDVIKWKHFPRNWPFVREIHRSPVNFPHKGQWRGALMFSLIYAWINDWVNNREAGDLRRQHGHYDVIVMLWCHCNVPDLGHAITAWKCFPCYWPFVRGITSGFPRKGPTMQSFYVLAVIWDA